MKIIYKKRFLKAFQKLSAKNQRAVTESLNTFHRNPFAVTLENHPLQGALKGKRSISARFDLRIIFEEYDQYMIVTMLTVGSHADVYR